MKRTPLRLLVIGTLCVLLGGAAQASAAPAAPISAAQGTACRLPAGTAGVPDVAAPGTLGFNLLQAAPKGVDLPATILYRDTQATFNRLWEFALSHGRMYTKPSGHAEGWRRVQLPKCLDGRIAAISADDDELLAVDTSGGVYTLDQVLNSPILWSWTSRWGPPLWVGLAGTSLPPGTIDWSASVLSPAEDDTWTDSAGNAQKVGGGKVTHLFALTGDGSHIVYLDPWLPTDYSYEVQTPLGGRFKSVALTAAASTIFVTNKFGDMYTRLYDFDMSGADTAFFRYSYEDQRGLTPAPHWGMQRLGVQHAALQLPAVGWVHQPKIPGSITSHISIHKTGTGSAARELRVEGRLAGRTGYWHKSVASSKWTFTATDEPLSRSLISNPTRDRSQDTLAAPASLTYRGSASEFRARIYGFSSTNERSPLELKFNDGATLTLVLHTVDGLRLTSRGPGIDSNPRAYDGMIEVPAHVLTNLDKQPHSVQTFVRGQLRGQRFNATSVLVSTHHFNIKALKLELTR